MPTDRIVRNPSLGIVARRTELGFAFAPENVALFWRLAALLCSVCLFYAYDWLPLRELLSHVTFSLLRIVGAPASTAVVNGSPTLQVSDAQYEMTADCTYVDMFLVLAPFMWDRKKPARHNIVSLTCLAFGVWTANSVRVFLAIYAHSKGYSWFMAHDLVDYVIYWPTIAVVVIRCLRRDWGRHDAYGRSIQFLE